MMGGQVVAEEHLAFGPGRLELRRPQEASGPAQAVVPCRGGRDQVSMSVHSAASAVRISGCGRGAVGLVPGQRRGDVTEGVHAFGYTTVV